MAATKARLTSAKLVRRLYEEELHRPPAGEGSPAARVAKRTGLSKRRVLELLESRDIDDSPHQAFLP